MSFPWATRREALIGLGAALTLPHLASAQAGGGRSAAEDLYALAREAYLFAYPIVVMDTTMRQVTNVPDARTVNMRAPFNQFAHARAYPAADERDVVRFNFDTLYSFAWLDLAREPVVISAPDTGGRYYMLPMLDMWSDLFCVIGTRTTGNQAGHYALTAAGWSGTLPAGVERIVAPTPNVWVLGRTQTNGPSDYATVHRIQEGYRLTTLSHWGRSDTAPARVATDPSVDDRTPPLLQVDALDGMAMLTRLAALLRTHPPHGNDYPILFRLRRLGIVPGQPFDTGRFDAAARDVINRAAKETLESLPAAFATSGRAVNGWILQNDNIGTYGTSYLKRAVIAKGGLGANLPEDAVYPVALTDAQGQPLTGGHRYRLRFPNGQLPPADAFWSLTMYDTDGFQVPNRLNRFALGDRDTMKRNADGSLDILMQVEPPGADQESNWLPAPRGGFQPTLRIYSPRAEVRDGRWVPPAITRLS